MNVFVLVELRSKGLGGYKAERKTTEGHIQEHLGMKLTFFPLNQTEKRQTILSQQQKIIHNSLCCECLHPSPQLLQSHTNAFSPSWCRTKHSVKLVCRPQEDLQTTLKSTLAVWL